MRRETEQRVEERELCMIIWYLCDRFRDIFTDTFFHSTVWPFEMVNPVLKTLTMESIRLFDVLAQDHTVERFQRARSQLKSDLGCLTRYFTAWNESKRVTFTYGKLPGLAIVSSVEENKINEYVAQQLHQEHTVFANTDINLFTRLYKHNQKKVKNLFSFTGESFDAIKYRNEHKLRGQQDALGVFEVSHQVSVSERNDDEIYSTYASMESSPAITFDHVPVSPSILAKRAGLSPENFSNVCIEETGTIVLPVARYMCDVIMKVRHKAEAKIWVHPLTGVLSFGVVAACNHSKTFTGEIDLKFRMCIPEGAIKPAFVPIDISSLMDLLMDNSIVRLNHGAKVVSVNSDSKELYMISRGNQTEMQTLFKLHPAEKGSFVLSTVPRGDKNAQWVCVRDDKLVVSADGYGINRFSLHRLSTYYSDWVLKDCCTSKLVVVTDDENLRVKQTNRHDASSFSFVRPQYGETKYCTDGSIQ
ncbi:hypothetical protein PHMEG_00020520 [Phytophthora megakarya]|uniref:Uncharacterized protein n=1 Tax=Phytophthora megakarya TaxID=4795 RepID=A0A225VP57_9STRA|nr:hypothetical protein PHMEG_00020520 [Phytophthora megakarya]